MKWNVKSFFVTCNKAIQTLLFYVCVFLCHKLLFNILCWIVLYLLMLRKIESYLLSCGIVFTIRKCVSLKSNTTFVFRETTHSVSIAFLPWRLSRIDVCITFLCCIHQNTSSQPGSNLWPPDYYSRNPWFLLGHVQYNLCLKLSCVNFWFLDIQVSFEYVAYEVLMEITIPFLIL